MRWNEWGLAVVIAAAFCKDKSEFAVNALQTCDISNFESASIKLEILFFIFLITNIYNADFVAVPR